MGLRVFLVRAIGGHPPALTIPVQCMNITSRIPRKACYFVTLCWVYSIWRLN